MYGVIRKSCRTEPKHNQNLKILAQIAKAKLRDGRIIFCCMHADFPRMRDQKTQRVFATYMMT